MIGSAVKIWQSGRAHQCDTMSVAISPVRMVRPAVLNCAASYASAPCAVHPTEHAREARQPEDRAEETHLLTAAARSGKVVVRPHQEGREDREENTCSTRRS